MKLKIATRIFNEEYFIVDFLRFYLDLGIDEIHIFDGASTDKTLNLIKLFNKNLNFIRKKIILVCSNEKFRHTSYLKQTLFCNLMLHYAMRNFIKEKEEVIWIFPDVDEFIKIPRNRNIKDFLSQNSHDFYRSVIIEWYLNPKLTNFPIKPLEFLKKINSDKIKGKIMDLWGDPFYKDNFIHLTNQNIKKLKFLNTISGFHRLILDKQLILPSNENYIIFNHLRGIPLQIFKTRVEKCLRLLESNKDEWSYQHFSQIKKIIEEYKAFYHKELKSYIKISKELKKISQFDNSKSYFNNVIMKDNIHKLGVSKPSMH